MVPLLLVALGLALTAAGGPGSVALGLALTAAGGPGSGLGLALTEAAPWTSLDQQQLDVGL